MVVEVANLSHVHQAVSTRWQVPAQRHLAQQLQGLGQWRGLILVWGAEASVNVLARRPAGTRYYYLYPLLTRGYQRPEQVRQLWADIRRWRPLLVDTAPWNSKVPPLAASRRARWKSPDERYGPSPELELLMLQLERLYEPVGEVPGRGWRVLVPRGEAWPDP